MNWMKLLVSNLHSVDYLHYVINSVKLTSSSFEYRRKGVE